MNVIDVFFLIKRSWNVLIMLYWLFLYKSGFVIFINFKYLMVGNFYSWIVLLVDVDVIMELFGESWI